MKKTAPSFETASSPQFLLTNLDSEEFNINICFLVSWQKINIVNIIQ